MYQPKPINPSLLRLNAAAKMVLEAINAGHIAAVQGRESQATDAADALQRAHDQAMEAYPSQASPFLLYRKEIMAGDNNIAAHLRLLVLHLWNSNNLVNMVWLVEEADKHHLAIAIELIESFARNGNRDACFINLAREIDDMYITEETAA